jgi:hypothetical protein
VRISERKKQLRERSSSEAAHHVTASSGEARIARERAPRASSSRAARGSTRQQQQQQTSRPARKARPRSPRFYYGFGLVGLVLSAILAESTVASYRSAVNKYPALLKAYHTALAKYQTVLAQYHAAHPHGTNPPKPPTMPHQPTLTAMDFALPVLYGALSVAYLYLGYRTFKRQQA